jgi:hypothetical protein
VDEFDSTGSPEMLSARANAGGIRTRRLFRDEIISRRAASAKHVLIGDRLALHQRSNPQRASNSQAVRILERYELRRIAEKGPEGIGAKLTHLKNGLDVLGVPLPSRTIELTIALACGQYVWCAGPEVLVVLCGLQPKLARARGERDHVGSFLTSAKRQGARGACLLPRVTIGMRETGRRDDTKISQREPFTPRSTSR